MSDQKWRFDVPPGAAVVTSTYVTVAHMPVLVVSHELDLEGGSTWQFHAGNGDYSTEVLQLVRLDEILEIDPQLRELATLPIGHSATRNTPEEKWVIEAEP